MSYRILRFVTGTHYRGVGDALYRRMPELASAPFEQQYREFFSTASVYGNAFSKAMHGLGNEADEIVYDLEPAQRVWAREHGIDTAAPDWREQTALSQIDALRPEVIFFQDLQTLPLAVRRDLKRRFPFIKLVVAFRCYPGGYDQLEGLDLIYGGTPGFVAEFIRHGMESRLLYHGFDDTSLATLGAGDEQRHGFTFFGSSGYGLPGGHWARYWYLHQLLRTTPLHAWLYEEWDIRYGGPEGGRPAAWATMTAAELAQVAVDPGLSPRPRPVGPLGELFPGRVEGPLFGLDMLREVAASRLTWNMHAQGGNGYVGNMRMFEATSVGCCLVTEEGRNLRELFEPDSEVVTYSSLEECREKVAWLLEHDGERREIARRGRRRALSCHTIRHRCEQVDADIRALLNRR